MKIKILYNQTTNGPGAVVRNLISGLNLLNHEVVSQGAQFDTCVCLQNPYDFQGFWNEISCVGPNCFYDEVISKYFNKFIVPSEWVKNLYSDKFFSFIHDKFDKIYVWPVGIDTDKWALSQSRPTIDALIYYKNSDKKYLQEAIDLCRSYNLSYNILEYGSYKEEELLKACERCKFCILVTKTESQGIAYMQILSSGLPCFVFEKNLWDDDSKYPFCKASSVPYFNESCGFKVDRNSDFNCKKSNFSKFLNELSKYNPRDFIEKNHTLKKSAKEFIEIISF